MRFRNRHKNKMQNIDPRARLVFVLIGILCLALIVKLFIVQIKDHDFYYNRAKKQHGVEKELLPLRGKIFFQDDNNSDIYGAAVNKDFGLLYTVPRDVEKPEETAEILYDIFKKEKHVKEVGEFFKKEDEVSLKNALAVVASLPLEEQSDEKRAEIIATHNAKFGLVEFAEARRLKIEKMLSDKKEEAIKKYLFALTKPNDPYEPLEGRVDTDILKQLYLRLLPMTDVKTVFSLAYEKMDEQTINSYVSFADFDKLEVRGNNILLNCSDGKKRIISLDGLGFVTEPFRFYPEQTIGSHVLGFVGFSAEGASGRYGLEGFFNEELTGEAGMIKGDSGAGSIIAIDGMEHEKAQNGSDLVLTIDRSIEYFACSKLNEAAERRKADGGSVIVSDPKTGAILAMCSWPDYDPNNYKNVEDIFVYNNPAIFNQYEPGSVFKTITMAAALDSGKITPDTTYNDDGFVMVGGWPKPIKNSDYATHGGHGVVNMSTILELSLNTGVTFAMRQMGQESFSEYVKKFGFGEKTGIELDAEVAGDIRSIENPKTAEVYFSTASFGQGIMTTPIQLVSAYNAIANNGIMMKPYLVKEIHYTDGTVETIEPREVRQVISKEAADYTKSMLANVAEVGHSKSVQIPGYFVGGKTGTAQVAVAGGYGTATYHTFIGMAPIEDPRFVVLVRLDDPKDAVWADQSAAPLFREIAEFLLKYMEVPKTRK